MSRSFCTAPSVIRKMNGMRGDGCSDGGVMSISTARRSGVIMSVRPSAKTCASHCSALCTFSGVAAMSDCWKKY